MFNRSDYDDFCDGPVLSDWHRVCRYPGLYYVTYPQFAFDPPDGEEYIRISRAPKQPGDNGVWFWICAEQVDNPPWGADDVLSCARGLQTSDFQSITESEFNILVKTQCHSLLAPVSIPLIHSRFRGGLAMQTMKTDFFVSLFAEYDTEYLHFYWHTTA